MQEIIENPIIMATSQFKASIILITFFGLLFLACATSDNKTKQPSNNVVGDNVCKFLKNGEMSFFKDVHEKMAY